jgi:signal transduction histidine kinase
LLERCRQQIERIQGIVGQLLEYSRPSRQQVRDVEVVASTHQLLALLQHDPRCKGVALQVEAEAPVSARADAALLDQVLSNLVINGARAAREHDREHPAVVVRIEAEGDVVRMDVEDSGAGVPEGLRAELFEPFFTTAKAGEGTGLGLALCQGLVEGMGGELSLIPEPGSAQAFSGARFRVKLPRGLPSSGANGAEPLPRPPGEVE